MTDIFQNVYGFQLPGTINTPMGGCSTHKSIVSAVEVGIKADTQHEPYCGTLQYVMEGNYVIDVKYFPRLIG